MLSFISNLAEKRISWLLLAAIAFLLEISALFFQYVMELAPCIMCIYQRTAVLGLLAAGLIGAIKPNNLVVRLLAFTTFAIASIWGWLLANEHIAMQNNTDPFAFMCEFEPNFPDFMPLHHWLPWFFEATGDCGEISWSFIGLSMPSWMQIIFAISTLVCVTLIACRLLAHKKV